jgi:phospholipid/cholesterol/gamma-HCH transport system substrate-binding protein
MKTSTSQKMKTGIFTIVGILLLVAAIFVIGSNKNMFGNTFNIYGTFRNVGGLQVGNNILFAGIKVGTIENISFVADTLVRVDMRMSADVKPFLKKDAVATVGSSGLMGDKVISILPGSNTENILLKDGDPIASVDPVGMEEIIAKFTAVADNAGIITSELAGMAKQIRNGDGSISKLLYTNTLSNSLEGTSANAQKMTASLAGIAAKINQGEGSIGSLVNTSVLSDRIDDLMVTTDSAVGSIQEAAARLSENMLAMQSSFLFRGYFKRKAKEEGKTIDSLKTDMELNPDDIELDEEELEEMIKEAQRALDAKRKKKDN